jgi:hypothetical protein
MAIRKPDKRKGILILAALAIFACGLFPPWLYVFDATGAVVTGQFEDNAAEMMTPWRGGHSEWSAGYRLVFKPPRADDEVRFWFEQNKRGPDAFGHLAFQHTWPGGIRLDLSRLMVEWVCILALSGAAWGLVRLDKERVSEERQRPVTGPDRKD